MSNTEYLVIEEGSANSFMEKLNDATEDGFAVISSNHFIVKHDSYGHPDPFETLFYALMVKNPVQVSNDFQYKILEELNELKFTLKDIVSNLKYLGE